MGRSDLGRYNLGALKPDTTVTPPNIVTFEKKTNGTQFITAKKITFLQYHVK